MTSAIRSNNVENIMKIALTTAGTSLEDALDSRFGRAPTFLIYDDQADTFELVDNQQNLNAAQGAGIQAAQNVARTGATAVITGHCGPKAFRVLTTAGIAIYNTTAETMREALQAFQTGDLKAAGSADVEGHWV